MTVAGGCHKRSDDIAVAIAEGKHFVALYVFVPAESEIIPAFLRYCRRSITVDDVDVKEIALMKLQHRTRENIFKASMGFEAPESPIDSCVVDLWFSIWLLLDGQLSPLTAGIQELQNNS